MHQKKEAVMDVRTLSCAAVDTKTGMFVATVMFTEQEDSSAMDNWKNRLQTTENRTVKGKYADSIKEGGLD